MGVTSAPPPLSRTRWDQAEFAGARDLLRPYAHTAAGARVGGCVADTAWWGRVRRDAG